MIKLTKSPKPQVLEDKGEAWRDELLAIVAKGDKPTEYQKGKYNQREVKDALIAETHGKCAYCEAKILHIDYGDIEHILPKAEVPELSFEWDNLTLACGVCNTKKRNYIDDVLPVLDPYTDEPEAQLLFFGPFVRPAPGDQSAALTERLLDLNRERLLERRTERLDQLLALATVLNDAKGFLKEILKEDFMREADDEREFASLARSVARQLEFI